jgi:hypothetical protein
MNCNAKFNNIKNLSVALLVLVGVLPKLMNKANIGLNQNIISMLVILMNESVKDNHSGISFSLIFYLYP